MKARARVAYRYTRPSSYGFIHALNSSGGFFRPPHARESRAVLPLAFLFYLPPPRPVPGRGETAANPVASSVAATSMAVQQLERSLIPSPDARQVLISSRPCHPSPSLPSLRASRAGVTARKRAIEQRTVDTDRNSNELLLPAGHGITVEIAAKSPLSRGSYKR